MNTAGSNADPNEPALADSGGVCNSTTRWTGAWGYSSYDPPLANPTPKLRAKNDRHGDSRKSGQTVRGSVGTLG